MLLTRPNILATLEHEDIARRIPHQGSMCLLDRVSAWNDEQINCEASSHRTLSNPLRAFGRLGAACGIEYAAQAMAVHGALVAEAKISTGAVKPAAQVGYLASVRGVTLYVERLDEQRGVLTIHAARISGDASIILYRFTVHAQQTLLLAGRAVVVLKPPHFARPGSVGVIPA